jgi:uncharacterized LabA/DUF88 family protein
VNQPTRPDRPPKLEIFVDGTNFHLAQAYNGVHFRVDLNQLATRLSRGFHFVKLNYYTSPLPDSRSEAYRRQQVFFGQLRKSSRINLVLGRNEPRFTDGRKHHVEKETDVNLAADMVVGAYRGRYDAAMLVAGDTDYVRAAGAVQEEGKKVIWGHPPAQKHSDQLAQVCDELIELDEKFLRTCQLNRPRR